MRHRVIAGVCGGLGRYFDVDPVIFRVVIAVLALTGGVGLLFYGIAWLFIPGPRGGRNEVQRLLSGRVESSGMAAVLVTLAGCGVFLSTLGSDGGEPFPLFVILAVLGAVSWSKRHRAAERWAEADGDVGHVAEAPPAAQPPPPPGAPPWWRDGLGDGQDRENVDGHAPGEDKEVGRSGSRSAISQQPRTLAGFALFCLAVLAGAGGTAASWSAPLGTSLQIGAACALAVLGAGLVVGSFCGRVRGGTVFLGVLVTVLLAGSAALPMSVEREWRRVGWTPTSAAEVRPRYELGTGHGTLDLTRVDPRGEQVVVRADVGAGVLRVLLPANAVVDVNARARVGVVRIPGYGGEDPDVVMGARQKRTLKPTGPKSTWLKGRLTLSLWTAVGEVEVVREAP